MIVSPLSPTYLLLRADLGGGNFKLMQGFPAFTKWHAGRTLKVRINGTNIAYIISNWPDAEWIGGCNDLKVRFLERIGAEDASLEAKRTEAILPDDGDYKYARAPMEHQRKSFLISREREAYALLMEQGTGKTKVILDTASWMFLEGKIDMLLVVAWPNGVHRMWVDDELEKDLSVPYQAAFWSANKTKKKLRTYDLVDQAPRDKLKVMTFNVEAFTSERAKDKILTCLRRNRCLMVIDQSASIKNPSALRTKFLIGDCSELAKYRRILDGDPVAEGADELYSQFKFLDPWIIGHDTWTAFRAEYCITNRFNAVCGYKNFDQLRKLIDPYCFRVLANDCLDLPPRIYKAWEFDLSREEKRIFTDLNRKSLAFFDPEELEGDDLPASGSIEEALAIVKNMRLQQISSGWWPEKDNFKSIEKIPTRLKSLLLLLEQNKGKALIFARFRADLELIQEVLGSKAVSYHGGVSESDRALAKKKFMEDDDTLYFVGQPRNAGIGHTLTAARHVIFYSNDPSLRLRAESEKRAHRKGLKNDLMIWDLVARGTQDRKIMSALQRKRDVSNEILQDPENFFLIED